MELRDVMTPNPTVCRAQDTVRDAAALMRDQDIGDVLVEENGGSLGIVTDRDIVTRAVAEGAAPTQPVEQLVTVEPASIDSENPIDDAVALMRSYAVRRLPVVHDGSVVGVVSLGDLARARDPGSALADISAAPPD